MLGRKERRQPELFVAGSLRELPPDDHVLVRVDRVLDLSWLTGEVAELDAALGGRPSIDLEVAVRLMLAGCLLGIVHDRRLLRGAGEPRAPLVRRLRAARTVARPLVTDPDPAALGRRAVPADLRAHGQGVPRGRHRPAPCGPRQGVPGARARSSTPTPR